MSTTTGAPATAPALDFVRDQLPGLLGITDPPLILVYDALVDQLATRRVFDGLSPQAARRVMYTVAHAAILDYPPRSAQDAALEVARHAERTLAGRAEVDRRVMGLAYVRAVEALLS
jgi:hypothetical protein